VSMVLAIIVVILGLLLAASGFAIIFFYFPRWLMHRYELTPRRKIVAYFALGGLLVPIVFTCRYLVTRTEMVTDAIFLWPTALILTDLDGHPSTSAVVANFGCAILSNVGLYAWLGVLTARIRETLS
jgi:hypothetical protein